MNKKSILQILIGLVLAIAVSLAIILPIKTCENKNNKNSSRNPLSEYSGEWDSAYGDNDWSGDQDGV